MSRYKVAEARVAKGLTQKELADRIGTTQQQIARYESGQNDLKASIIIKMSEVLGVTISYLLGLDGPSDKELLSEEESLLVGLYRSTDRRGRDAIMAVARSQAGDERAPEADRESA